MQEREHYIEGIRVDILAAEKKLEKTLQQVQDEDAAVRKAGLQMTAELEKQGNEEAGKLSLVLERRSRSLAIRPGRKSMSR